MLRASEAEPGTAEAAWLRPDLLHALPPVRWAPRPERVVVVAPHPDDEVLGAGGLLRQLAGAGTAIEIVAVTDGEGSHPGSKRVSRRELADRRARERHAALARLGIQPAWLTRVGLPDGGVADWADRLQDAIAGRLSRDAGATLCLAPWRHDGHPDHDAAGLAAAGASQAAGIRLAEYLVWTWHWATPTSGPVPWPSARRVNLSRRDLAAKRWATAAFVSQIRSIGPDIGDAAILPPPVLAHFRRPFEVLLL